MRVNLKIDKIVMDGLEPDSEQISKIRASIEQELATMLSNQGAINLMRSKHLLSTLKNKWTIGGDDPSILGKQVAREISRRIHDE
jgi:hypothetical protein